MTGDRLPNPPDRADSEPAGVYGLRVFVWIVAHDNLTATCSDDQLSLAAYAAVGASAAPGYSECVYARLSAARHAIAAAQRRRDAYAAGVQRAGVSGTPTPDSDRPNAGPMAPLQDRPIVRPPNPGHARTPVLEPDIAF